MIRGRSRAICKALFAVSIIASASGAHAADDAAIAQGSNLSGDQAVTTGPPNPRPPIKKPERGQWPFKRWSYAKAYTYNFFQDRPVPLQLVARDGRWSPHIRSEQLISERQAFAAATLVQRSRGTFETSSCTFPRHAVVYFDASDKPVAAASICFDCVGILAWPDYEHADDVTPQAYAKMERKFVATLAGWKKLFAGELKLPITYDGAR